MNNSIAWRPKRGNLSLTLLLFAAGLLICSAVTASGERLSITRITFLGIEFLGGLIFSFLGWQIHKNDELFNQFKKYANEKAISSLLASLIFLFISSWILAWTPAEQYGQLYYYFIGVYPLIVWLVFFSGVAIYFSLAHRFGINLNNWKGFALTQRSTLIISGTAIILFIILTWVASFRVIGVKPGEEDFWYGAGAPVLAFQVFISLILGYGLSAAISKFSKRKIFPTFWINSFLFLFIWIVAAVTWAVEPAKPDFLITQPVAPNYELYPDYDARNYDLMSQFALIGQGINNHSFFDRILYPAFLTYLHNFAGQDYTVLMAYQASVYAVLPAILFLLATSILKRSAGLSLGFLTIFRGINQIDIGNIIETAHQKHFLTEYPTAILMALATFFLVKWAKEPKNNWKWAGFAGCIIGLSTLLRPHTLVIIPVFFVLAVIVYGFRSRFWPIIGILFLSTALLGILPWIQFGGQNVSIFSLYFVRINDVIRQRYPQIILPQGNMPQPAAQSTNNAHEARFKQASSTEKNIPAFTIDNFVNNLVTSIQSLPTTPFYLSPRDVVKKTENFWKPYWDGRITNWAKVLIPFNLLILAFGLGTAWKSAKISGVIPLIIMFSYYLVNSLGRTSGGRYLVPVDWVVYIYYILGLAYLIDTAKIFFISPSASETDVPQIIKSTLPVWKNVLLVIFFSYGLGLLIPLAQNINPLHFQLTQQLNDGQKITSYASNQLGVSETNLSIFLASKNAIILTGRSLYPRQFFKDQGLDVSVYRYYHPMPFPRTIFTLIGRTGENVIVLPRIEAALIPHSTDVIVLGCLSPGFVSAWAVLRLDNQNNLYRTPVGIPLACPLPDPICDNNKICK